MRKKSKKTIAILNELQYIQNETEWILESVKKIRKRLK